MQCDQQIEVSKAALPPHALALYQQQITMAHGESSQEVKQQQLPGQLGKQQLYNPQADRDKEALCTGSPRIRLHSPSMNDKDGMHTSIKRKICFITHIEGVNSHISESLIRSLASYGAFPLYGSSTSRLLYSTFFSVFPLERVPGTILVTALSRFQAVRADTKNYIDILLATDWSEGVLPGGRRPMSSLAVNLTVRYY